MAHESKKERNGRRGKKESILSSVGREQRDEEYIQKQLIEIYENGDGSMPDMKHFQKRKRNRVIRAFFMLVFSIIFLVSVLMGGYFILFPNSRFSANDIILTVGAEPTVTIGDEVTYRIRYHNAQNIPLSRVSLRVRYPEGFSYTSSSVDAITDNHDEWALGTLDADESGYIDISGTLSGSMGEEKAVRVFMNYTPANFNSVFEKVAQSKTALAASPVTVEVNGPSEVVSGKAISFAVVVRRGEATDLPPLYVTVDPGTVFVKKESSPASVQFSDYRWSTSSTADTEIAIQGTVTVPVGSQSVSIPVRVIGTKNGQDYVYAENIYTLTAAERQSTVAVTVNGTDNDATVKPGETLSFAVTVKNTGTTAMQNVVAKVTLDAPSNKDRSIIRWQDVDNPNEGDIVGEQVSAQIRRGAISWNSSYVPGLKSIAPGQSVAITFAVPVKTTKDTDYGTFASFGVSVAGSVQFTRDGKQEIASTNPQTVSVVSDTRFEVRDEKQVSGSTETHTVQWVVSNTVHPLKDIRVEADIYGNVEFDEKKMTVPAGIVTYDKEKKKIIWTVPQMTDSTDVLALEMTLVLPNRNPTQTKLMSRPQFTATDDVVGKPIAMTGEEINL